MFAREHLRVAPSRREDHEVSPSRSGDLRVLVEEFREVMQPADKLGTLIRIGVIAHFTSLPSGFLLF
jgi:hypothetical protein